MLNQRTVCNNLCAKISSSSAYSGKTKKNLVYLDEDEEGAELGSDVEHEARVGGEPLDVTLVAGVHEQRPGDAAFAAGPPPVGVVDEVLLVEEHGRVGREGEVVQLLREVVRRERLRRRAVAGAGGAIGGGGELAVPVPAARSLALQSLQVQRNEWRERSPGGVGGARCCCGCRRREGCEE